VRERDGVLTVACDAAVWAQELDLMSERVLAALNEALGRRALHRLRVHAAGRPR
jgi:predicted nucleic acid-binding Zn ribbon protein